MLTARIAVLVSGGGTNLQALLDSQARGALKSGEIALVIADKPGVGAIARAERAHVPCAVIPRREAGFEERVLAALAADPAVTLPAADVYPLEDRLLTAGAVTITEMEGRV